MGLPKLLRCVLPEPAVAALLRVSGRSMYFSGPYPDWSQALERSAGYDDVSIVRRVAEATRDVIAGRAAYERDAVTFSRPSMPSAVLSVLLRHLLAHPGPLAVVDFGGSLGTIYRHCRPYLPSSTRVIWHVVEQASFVDIGRAEFTTSELDFHPTLDDLPAAVTPPVLLVSGSLQYLPDAYRQLDAFDRSSAGTLFIDRLSIADVPDDLIGVQHVPASIYAGSYPGWVFSRGRLLERLSRHWNLVGEHECPTDGSFALGGVRFDYRGLLLERR